MWKFKTDLEQNLELSVSHHEQCSWELVFQPRNRFESKQVFDISQAKGPW